jgi:hypothetical protein
MTYLTAFLPERAVYVDYLATLAVFRDQFSYQKNVRFWKYHNLYFNLLSLKQYDIHAFRSKTWLSFFSRGCCLFQRCNLYFYQRAVYWDFLIFILTRESNLLRLYFLSLSQISSLVRLYFLYSYQRYSLIWLLKLYSYQYIAAY